MLVLSRKPMERIRIGDDIVVTVMEIRTGSVRLGIDAPRDRRIIREEVEIVWNLTETAAVREQQELVEA